MTATKKKYVIQEQTGKHLVTQGGAFTPPMEFDGKRAADKANIGLNGVVGVLKDKVGFVPADKDDFIIKGREMLLRLGAVTTPGCSRHFAINTKYGILRITMHSRCGERGNGPGDFMCVFDNIEAAQAGGIFGDKKSFSGKWNHHYFGDWEQSSALVDFEYSLKRIIPQWILATSVEALLPYINSEGLDPNGVVWLDKSKAALDLLK